MSLSLHLGLVKVIDIVANIDGMVQETLLYLIGNEKVLSAVSYSSQILSDKVGYNLFMYYLE
jgi:hypothetical protein